MKGALSLLLVSVVVLPLAACDDSDALGSSSLPVAGDDKDGIALEQLIPAPGVLGPIVINEVTTGPGQSIELFNRSKHAFDISGWYVVNLEFDLGDAYVFPEGSTIEPGEYLVLSAHEHLPNLELRDEDGVFFFAHNDDLADATLWLKTEANVSWCRQDSGDGDFVACKLTTLGERN